MKKTFLARRNALLSSARFSAGAVALGVAILFLLIRLVAPDIFLTLFSPFFQASRALAEKEYALFAGFRNASALTLENERLSEVNAELSRENSALTEQLDGITGLAPALSSIVAGVVARPPESPYDTLVLAAGRAEGVTSGVEAFGGGGVPIGIVSSVSEHFSHVTLFSSPTMSIVGWVGSKHVPLALLGAGAGAITATSPRSAAVVVGDTVYAPGPGNIPFGTVVRIDDNPSSSSVTLRIKSTLNLFSITWAALRDTGVVREAASTTKPILP